MTTIDFVRRRPETTGRPWLWFDLDDTLYDFEANSLTALHLIYDEAGLQRWWPDAQTWIDEYHDFNRKLWTEYSHGLISRDVLRMERFRQPLVARGCPDREARELSSRLDPLYLGKFATLHATIPDARETLRRLSQSYNIGVLSNGFREVQAGKINNTGLRPYIDCVVLSDEIEINKPDPRLFRYAERKAGTTAEDCLLIGDNPDTDIAGALAAGWKTVWFNPACKSSAAIPDSVAQIRRLAQLWPSTDAETAF